MVNIIIDGKNIEVPEGTTVLRAATMAGIHIPTLCDHPHLTPYGGCRLCLVEVEGARVLQPSCTLPVSNNMVVHTDTTKVQEARKFVLTLIFSERNHFCPYCQVSGGDCELQNSAYHEEMTHWPLQPNWQKFEVDASHPFLIIDHNRCILCRRCARACNELVGNATLGFEERGAKTTLIADRGLPIGESTCVSCGTCVQICPTGALIDRLSAYHGHEKDLQHTKTICIGCSIGCGIEVLTRDNHVVRINGDWDAPVNSGIICKTGRYLPLNEERERIQHPMLRKDGVLQKVTWDEALDAAAQKLKAVAQNVSSEKKNSRVAAMVSTRLPAEALSLFKQVFSDHLHSNMVTSFEEGQSTSLPASQASILKQSFEGSLTMLKKASCVILLGVDLTNEHEVAGFMVKQALQNGSKLIVIDSNPNSFEGMANCVLSATKGTESDILQGLAAAIAKLGYAKKSFSFQPNSILKTASEKTGIATDQFLKAAHLAMTSGSPAMIYGKGFTKKSTPQSFEILLETARLMGVIGEQKESSLINVKGDANSFVASQYSLEEPFHINGHQVAYIAIGDDQPTQWMAKYLEKTPSLIVQASYKSNLTEKADVVFPVEMWAEQEGHYLNMEGRLQKSQQTLIAPENVRTNANVLNDLAERMGIKVSGDWKTQLSQRIPMVKLLENA